MFERRREWKGQICLAFLLIYIYIPGAAFVMERGGIWMDGWMDGQLMRPGVFSLYPFCVVFFVTYTFPVLSIFIKSSFCLLFWHLPMLNDI